MDVRIARVDWELAKANVDRMNSIHFFKEVRDEGWITELSIVNSSARLYQDAAMLYEDVIQANIPESKQQAWTEFLYPILLSQHDSNHTPALEFESVVLAVEPSEIRRIAEIWAGLDGDDLISDANIDPDGAFCYPADFAEYVSSLGKTVEAAVENQQGLIMFCWL